MSEGVSSRMRQLLVLEPKYVHFSTGGWQLDDFGIWITEIINGKDLFLPCKARVGSLSES